MIGSIRVTQPIEASLLSLSHAKPDPTIVAKNTLDTTMIYYQRQGLLKRDPSDLAQIES